MVFLRLKRHVLRDRPCNLKGGGGVMVLCFVQNFFFGLHKSYSIYILCRAKCEFFFKNKTLGYMTKTLNQIIFFFLHQNQNIFFIFSHYDSLCDVRKKTTEWLILIKKNEINSLHVYSCYDFICKELFVVRLSKNQYKSTIYTHNSYNM